ncbi:hypothetical protein KW807_02110 [Candidatus Parcubacteria bacterium]|nr:hypothetical protein [Candidatus Parcubacteria bacterium]
MSKYGLILGLFVLAAILMLLGVGYLIFKPDHYEAPKDGRDLRAGWLSTTDPESGLNFEYPANFGTKYIEPLDWPPRVRVEQRPLMCTNAGEVGARAGQSVTRVIEGEEYCVTTLSQDSYNQYVYATTKEPGVVYVSFSTHLRDCTTYSESERRECESEEASFSPDITINEILKSGLGE